MSKNVVYSVITHKYDPIWSIPPKTNHYRQVAHEPEDWDFILFEDNDLNYADYVDMYDDLKKQWNDPTNHPYASRFSKKSDFGEHHYLNFGMREKRKLPEPREQFLSHDTYKSGWNIIKINLIDGNPIKTQRKFKICNDFIFNNYEKSIYVDGNMRMLEKPEHLWNLFGSDFTLMRHPVRSTIRAEQQAITTYEKDRPEITKSQIEKYLSEGYIDNDLVETGILFRNHTEKVVDLSHFWYKEVLRHSHRDQLSFNYSCWKKNFQYNTIPIHAHALYYDTNLFRLLPHAK